MTSPWSFLKPITSAASVGKLRRGISVSGGTLSNVRSRAKYPAFASGLGEMVRSESIGPKCWIGLWYGTFLVLL